MDALLVIVIAGLLVEINYAIVCAWRMRQRYGRRMLESLLWDRLVQAEFRTVIAGIAIAVVAIWTLAALVGLLGPIPRPWGTLGLAAGLALLFWGPIADWYTLRGLERGRIGEGD